MKRPLAIIVLSQFAGTSLWFAGNAVVPELIEAFKFDEHAVRSITTAVQLGFISGTLIFALLAIADRFKPSKVFFVSACIAAATNAAVLFASDQMTVLLLRFATGFFIAGIYPVGMKIAADYYQQGLGKALGYLVGALVLGTAFPHFLKGSGFHFPWKSVMIFTSAFAVFGGLLILLFVPDGPFRKSAQRFHFTQVFAAFRSSNFRSAAFGYFGHMWELYTFWAFVPLFINWHVILKGNTSFNNSILSFATIAIGCVSCIIGGLISQKTGSKKVAAAALFISGTCCLFFYPIIHAGTSWFIIFLLIWGIAVIADSPQFSAMVAATAPAEQKGTALTIVTSIGFAITVVSIFIFDYLFFNASPYFFSALLAAGPFIGLIALLYGRNN